MFDETRLRTRGNSRHAGEYRASRAPFNFNFVSSSNRSPSRSRDADWPSIFARGNDGDAERLNEPAVTNATSRYTETEPVARGTMLERMLVPLTTGRRLG